MGLIAFLLLILIPASLVFVVLSIVQKRRRSHDARLGKPNYQRRIIIFSVVPVVCIAVLFFTGKFYSLSMTFQMPYVYYQQLNNNSPETEFVARDGRIFTGDKAVTVNENFGAHINFGQEIFRSIDGLISERLFRYSDEYIPEQYRASSVSDVGYFVFIRHYAENGDLAYINGARAFAHYIDVVICDNGGVLAEETFKGNFEATTSGSDTLGPAPDSAVSEWIEEQLARFISERPSTTE